MKKNILFLITFLFFQNLFSQGLPEKLCGIWEGKDRYIFIEEMEEEVVVVLKEYYGWYLDRAAESLEKSEKYPRSLNAATHKTPEHVKIELNKTLLTQNSLEDKIYEKVDECAWEIKLNYSKFENNLIPVAVINDELYTNFCTKSPQWNEQGKLIIDSNGQWIGNATTRGITINSQITDQNIELLLITENKMYNLRYWYSDMDYLNESVLFKYGAEEFQVPKHIFSCGNNYSCVTGKSKKVRNTMPAEILDTDFNQGKFKMNSQKTVMALDSEPYLKQLADKNTFEALIQIIKEQNSKRKPDPKPLFPEEELDWHWDLIDLLEKDNQIIQEVRERQRSFGPRAKDIKNISNK